MNKAIDLSLYLVTNRQEMTFDRFYEFVERAVQGGVTAVQLREKNLSTDEMIKVANQIQKIIKPKKIPLIINDNIEVALAVNADGIHLGQRDLDAKTARKLLGTDAIIGLSIETIAQAYNAFSAEIDYLAASPLFPTNTKQDCSRPWGIERLKELCLISTKPIVAIGGINDKNLEQIVKCGVAGIAIASFIFQAACPEKAAHKLLMEFKRWK
jgi:thiamine-phosphate pyrophosphorylase